MDSIKTRLRQFRVPGVVAFLAVSAAAVAQVESPVQSLMRQTVVPSSDALWAVTAPPKTDDAWRDLEAAAARLVEAGATLRGPIVGRDGVSHAEEPEWRAAAEALVTAAAQARAATTARDLAAFQQATDAMYTSCEDCHAKYLTGAVRGL